MRHTPRLTGSAVFMLFADLTVITVSYFCLTMRTYFICVSIKKMSVYALNYLHFLLPILINLHSALRSSGSPILKFTPNTFHTIWADILHNAVHLKYLRHPIRLFPILHALSDYMYKSYLSSYIDNWSYSFLFLF